MTKKQKKLLRKIVISAVLYLLVLLIPDFKYKGVLYSIPYLPVGFDVLKGAFLRIINRQWFDEKFLMSIATIGAFCIGEYSEAVFVMLLYNIGELFESVAVGNSRKSIKALMSIKPDVAYLENGNEVPPETVEQGNIIVIKPGDKVPLDGIVVEGETSVDMKALTGESLPVDLKAGDKILSGSVNLNGVIKAKTISEYKNSTVAKILELVENSSANKAKTESFITRFASYYTPVVVLLAVLVGVIVPIFAGNFSGWLEKAFIFLVVSCPCALVISVPLTYFCAIGKASSQGILIKGSNYLDVMAKVNLLATDKTGTLTKGEFKVSKVTAENISKEELINLAASAEQYSNHPIAVAIRNEATAIMESCDIKELAGVGVSAVVDGKTVKVGKPQEKAYENTMVVVETDGQIAGSIEVEDTVKEDALKTVKGLLKMGVKTFMLTGDSESTAKKVAEETGVWGYRASLMPEDKVKEVEKLIKTNKVAFAGDGINDAPTLAMADVGIAMGAIGSDAAIEAADIVIMDDSLKKIPYLISLAKRTRSIVWQNIVFALLVKILVMALSLFNMGNMWIAVFADVGVSVIAILNAIRIKK
ncbi:MAG: cadmium-translocating P-type ATPase [Clostridia bacterium]|nr:cadmium-translocating P-type ATPase [Clostridia bacterium]